MGDIGKQMELLSDRKPQLVVEFLVFNQPRTSPMNCGGGV